MLTAAAVGKPRPEWWAQVLQEESVGRELKGERLQEGPLVLGW